MVLGGTCSVLRLRIARDRRRQGAEFIPCRFQSPGASGTHGRTAADDCSCPVERVAALCVRCCVIDTVNVLGPSERFPSTAESLRRKSHNDTKCGVFSVVNGDTRGGAGMPARARLVTRVAARDGATRSEQALDNISIEDVYAYVSRKSNLHFCPAHVGCPSGGCGLLLQLC
jgi:hypothetical protein